MRAAASTAAICFCTSPGNRSPSRGSCSSSLASFAVLALFATVDSAGVDAGCCVVVKGIIFEIDVMTSDVCSETFCRSRDISAEGVGDPVLDDELDVEFSNSL